MKASPFVLLVATFASAAALLLTGCAASRSPSLTTVRQVDLHRYAGKWHEVARLPNAFQNTGEGALAEYRPQADGRIAVTNTALGPNGKHREIRGTAEPVPGSGGARLRVRFEGLASLAPVAEEGNYWIVALDREHYSYAMVGTPDRRFLWLLARQPSLPEKTKSALVDRAAALGFPTQDLVPY